MTTSPSRPNPPAAPAMPLVAVACPSCFAALAVGTDLAGLPADCPQCGAGFRVPPLEPPAAARPTPRDTRASVAVNPGRKSAGTSEPARANAAGALTADPVTADPVTADPVTADLSVTPETRPGPQAGSELAVREPVRTVGSGEGAIVLRRLSTAERAARRTRRNLVMLVGGVSILLTIVLLLGRRR